MKSILSILCLMLVVPIQAAEKASNGRNEILIRGSVFAKGQAIAISPSVGNLNISSVSQVIESAMEANSDLVYGDFNDGERTWVRFEKNGAGDLEKTKIKGVSSGQQKFMNDLEIQVVQHEGRKVLEFASRVYVFDKSAGVLRYGFAIDQSWEEKGQNTPYVRTENELKILGKALISSQKMGVEVLLTEMSISSILEILTQTVSRDRNLAYMVFNWPPMKVEAIRKAKEVRSVVTKNQNEIGEHAPMTTVDWEGKKVLEMTIPIKNGLLRYGLTLN